MPALTLSNFETRGDYDGHNIQASMDIGESSNTVTYNEQRLDSVTVLPSSTSTATISARNDQHQSEESKARAAPLSARGPGTVAHESTLQEQSTKKAVLFRLQNGPILDFNTMEYNTSPAYESDGVLRDQPPQALESQPSQQQRTTSSVPAFISSFTSSIITLIVGGSHSPACEPSPTPFYIHRDILAKHSLFFHAAFGNGNDQADGDEWIEKKSLTMYLPEERAEDIGWLVKWLYWWDGISRNGTCKSCASCCSPGLWHPAIDPALEEYSAYLSNQHHYHRLRGPEHKRPLPPQFGPLIRLYIVADKYSITSSTNSLKNLISQRILHVAKTARCVPNKEDVASLWDNIVTEEPDHSPPPAATRAPGLERMCYQTGHEEIRAGGLKSVFLDLFVALSPNVANEMFSQGQAWHVGFLQDLVIRLVGLHGAVGAGVIGGIRVGEREMERGEKEGHGNGNADVGESNSVVFERMRVAKVRILG